MRRAAGLSIAAVVLSITLGVLVGLLIHTGMAQRAGGHRPPAGTSGQIASGDGSLEESDKLGLADPGSSAGSVASLPAPWPVAVTPVPSALASAGPSSGSDPGEAPGGAGGDDPTTTTITVTGGTATTAGTAGTPRGGTASSSSAAGTPGTSATPTTRTAPRAAHMTSTGARTTRASRTPTGTGSPVTADPRSPVAGGSCGRLGAKSATSARATLYCQHDLRNGRLRWRAVTDGGGCLNQAMTGTGTDGHHYACRLGPHGLNHWQRIG